MERTASAPSALVMEQLAAIPEAQLLPAAGGPSHPAVRFTTLLLSGPAWAVERVAEGVAQHCGRSMANAQSAGRLMSMCHRQSREPSAM